MNDSRDGVVFLFPGEGGEHERMGRTLAARYPVFAAAVTAAGDAVAAAGGPRVWTPRYGFRPAGTAVGPPGAESAYAQPEFTQPALFAYQVALAGLLVSWGVTPDAVVGHGIGEVAAAVTAGALPLPDAATVAVARGRAVARVQDSVAVAELLTSESEVIRLVEPMGEKVAITAVNGPRSVLISGATQHVDVVIRRAERRGIAAARTARGGTAHGPSAGEVVPEFRTTLERIGPTVPRIRVYSGSRAGRVIDSAVMSAPYWAENLTRRVELHAALRQAADDGMTTVLELGPEPLLAEAVRAIPRFTHSTYPVAQRDDEGTAFLTCLAQLHAARTLGAAAAGRPGRTKNRENPYSGTTRVLDREAGRDDGTHRIGRTEMPEGAGSSSPAVAFTEREGDRDSAQPDRPPGFAPTTDRGADRDRESGGEDLRAEVTGAGTLASIRLADDPPPTDIIAWTRMVDANRAIRFMAGRVAVDTPMEIDSAGTYVVSGGLGALGSVMVRRLLAAGARDVVVPTRSPRPVPPLLEGFEDRIVVVRCDTADRQDLDNALRDIRETGCTIRGVVHAAQVFEDTVVGAAVSADSAIGPELVGQSRTGHPGSMSEDPALDAGRLARRFARISAAAANLIELTAADPVAFIAVFSTPVTGSSRPTGPPVDNSWVYPDTADPRGN